jgi:hypothetical protein
MTRKTAGQLDRDIAEALGGRRVAPVDKFAGVQPGTLVRRSKHWYSQHPSWAPHQLGIVIDRNVYARDESDPRQGLITFPVIHWEGETSSSGTHPDNVELAPSKYQTAKRGRR